MLFVDPDLRSYPGLCAVEDDSALSYFPDISPRGVHHSSPKQLSACGAPSSFHVQGAAMLPVYPGA